MRAELWVNVVVGLGLVAGAAAAYYCVQASTDVTIACVKELVPATGAYFKATDQTDRALEQLRQCEAAIDAYLKTPSEGSKRLCPPPPRPVLQPGQRRPDTSHH